ncbi:MAG: DNA internalization-related competence protein ComEC/Rec2 [Clostridia bacterium]|nr:DNA internalization-related competence protein ComEC/Rec2 [Clostridia bacterium]
MYRSLNTRISAQAPRAVRKIMTAALGYTAALAAAHYFLPSGWIPWCAAGLSLASFFAFILRGDTRQRALLLILSASVGFLWYWGYDAVFIAPAEALAGETLTVTARVTEASEERGDYSVCYIRLTEEGLPRTKVAVYDFYGNMPDLAPGDIISAKLEFSPATVSYGEETDVYSSRGVFIRAYMESAPVTEGRAALAFLYFPKTLARWVQNSVAELFTEDTAGYIKALLTGDKSSLYEDRALYNSLGTAGIRHTVAVSGMHLAYLWGFLCLFLHNRRKAAALGIPVLWVFALLAGFTPSVVRASFMLSMAAAAPLLGRENDDLTSISAILLILLLSNPVSVGSVSLQLSFSAMAGIVLISQRVYSWCDEKWKKPAKKKAPFRGFLLASFSASVGALVFTTPLCALHFGYVSLISPLTNMLVLWVLPICFIGGYAAVAAGAAFVPLGIGAAFIVSWFVRYIILVAKVLSALPFAAVYTGNNLVGWWLVFTYAVFLCAYLRRREAPFRPVTPISISVIALAAVLVGTAIFYNSAASVTAIDVGQGQSIAVFEGSDTVLIDCGGGGTWEDAGDTAADYLQGCGRTRVDVLVLTHLHEDHAGGVAELLSRVDVKHLVLPAGTDDGDGLRDGIIETAEANGTEITYISEDTDMTVGNISLRLFAPLPVGDENERGIIIIASIGDYDILVTGDVNATVERMLIESAALPDFELLVAGHHGSRYSTSFELLDAINAETAIVSVGYNTYGHPTEEALWRLSAYGMEILRTDEIGNVTIRIDEHGQ